MTLSWMGILRYHIRFEFEMDCFLTSDRQAPLHFVTHLNRPLLSMLSLFMLGDGLSWASCSYSTHPRSVPGRHWVHVPAQELKAQGITADEAGQHCFRDDVPFFPASFLEY